MSTSYQDVEVNKMPSFSVALQLICGLQYHLLDAYPVFSKVYAIGVAIPVSCSTAEPGCTFFALKQANLEDDPPWCKID